MITIDDIRQKYPDYNDLSDKDLADSIHGKHYSDLPREDFYKKIGYTPDKGSNKPLPSAFDLSSRGETSRTGQAALFNVSPDTAGSKSYGPLGLNSKSGSVASFIKDNPQFGLTAPPGTPEFDQQWRKAAATQGDDFQKAHENWHQKNIVGGLSDSMTKAGIGPVIANDPRVQTYMADRKVQMGGAGLNTALAAARNSSSPEEFIHTISQVDKSRIPDNFRSYLRDHPNDVRGLANRIDLRHNTALSMADPDTTASMVDFHRGGGTAAAPVQMAQNTSSSATPPQGALGQEWIQHYNRSIMAGNSAHDAALLADKIMAAREKFMPQYGGPNEFGQGIRTEPGQPPQPYSVPGMLGKVQPFGKTPLQEQLQVGPDGRLHQKILMPEFQAPSGASTSPSAPAAPAAPAPRPSPPIAPAVAPSMRAAPAPVVQAPPAMPTGPGSSVAPALAARPPVAPTAATAEPTENPWKLASDVVIAPGRPITRQEVAEAETNAGAHDAGDWKQYVATANAMPKISSSYSGPDVIGLAKTAAGDPDPGKRQQALNDLIGMESLEKAELNKADKIDTDTAKENAEVAKAITEGGSQGIKLQHSLKLAKSLLNQPNFESGKFSAPVTTVRNAMGEIKRFAESYKNEDGTLKFPGMVDWLNKTSPEKASPNEVFQKVVAGSVLQSLRQMLGPNSGQFRVQELKLLEQAYGNPNLSIEGNKVVMDMLDRLNDRAIVYKKMADTYKKTHNGIDSNFTSMMDQYAEDHPVFNPHDYDDLLSVVTTGAPPGSTSPVPSKTPGSTAPSSPATPAPSKPPKNAPKGGTFRPPGLEEEMRRRGISP